MNTLSCFPAPLRALGEEVREVLTIVQVWALGDKDRVGGVVVFSSQ